MTEWRLEFLPKGQLDSQLVASLLFCLTGQGVRYNVGEYPGRYQIIPGDSDGEPIEVEEESIDERTERLGEFLTEYTKVDLATASASIGVAYDTFDPPIHFTFGIGSRANDTDRHSVEFIVSGPEIGVDEHDRFMGIVELGKTLFERFPFRFATYRTEHTTRITSCETLSETIGRVVFIDETLADQLRTEIITATPGFERTQLSTGGWLLVATPSATGDPSSVREFRSHLQKYWSDSSSAKR